MPRAPQGRYLFTAYKRQSFRVAAFFPTPHRRHAELHYDMRISFSCWPARALASSRSVKRRAGRSAIPHSASSVGRRRAKMPPAEHTRLVLSFCAVARRRIATESSHADSFATPRSRQCHTPPSQSRKAMTISRRPDIVFAIGCHRLIPYHTMYPLVLISCTSPFICTMPCTDR